MKKKKKNEFVIGELHSSIFFKKTLRYSESSKLDVIRWLAMLHFQFADLEYYTLVNIIP